MLSAYQKFLLSVWAFAGLLGVFVSASLLGILIKAALPDLSEDGIGTIYVLIILVMSAVFIAVSLTKRDEFEFLDKLYHAGRASFLNDGYSEGRIYRWRVELLLVEKWDLHTGKSGCAINFENICAFLDDEYDINVDDIREWREAGMSRKALSRQQARDIVKLIAQKIDLT